jgi:hypothetical protein
MQVSQSPNRSHQSSDSWPTRPTGSRRGLHGREARRSYGHIGRPIIASNHRSLALDRAAALDYALKAMVADSGAQVLAVKRPVEWGPTVARVAGEIHAQYVIGFSPAVRNGKVHKLEVKTRTKRQSVRTRKSYVAVAPGG